MGKFLLVGLLLVATPAISQLYSRLDSVMRATTQPTLPGAALLVIANGKIIYRNGYGLANVKTKSLITSRTNFRMASISKQFTAMGVLLLEKEGKLSLDDPLTKFFPDFNPHVGQQVRIRHLLTHTSGILDYESVMDPNQHRQLLDSDVLTLLKKRDSLYFKPGSQFRYSNSAYCLLALITEHVSGQSFASFIRQHIFQPLHMTKSTVYEAGKPIANRAMGYRQKADAFVFSDQSITSATKGDGGVYTSLVDYQKWNVALWKGTLLNLNLALKHVGKAIPQTLDSYYGDGWFYRNPNNPILFHSGSTCGFNNYVVSIPSKKFLVAYFSNKATNKTNAASLVKILADAEYPELTDILTLDDLTQ